MYDGNLRTQLSVGDDVWLGTIDFFVEPDTVIEHKATNGANFVRNCAGSSPGTATSMGRSGNWICFV
jgi:hypothetical protein